MISSNKTVPLLFASDLAEMPASWQGFAGTVAYPPGREAVGSSLTPVVDNRLLEIYERAVDPANPVLLRDLYLGRVEAELGRAARRPELAEVWRRSRRRRTVTPQDVLQSRATPVLVQELLTWFYRHDLDTALHTKDHILLSSGSIDETRFGLPPTLKDCIRYALDRDWYGYSDTRGRGPVREAIAALENARLGAALYTKDNVALTLGGTFAVSALLDFINRQAQPTATAALCAIPNYPPLVAAIARQMPTTLVPLSTGAGFTSLGALCTSLQGDTPLVFLQTVMNPTGTPVVEAELERLISSAAPATMILLDEAHECLGPLPQRSRFRAAANVVRISSFSKTLAVPGLKLGWILADKLFIADYSEYASTTYGGPPSIFYLLIEVMARMERWMLEGVARIGPAHLREFEAAYGLTLQRLERAYQSYRGYRTSWEQSLIAARNAAVDMAQAAGFDLVRPSHSINVTLRLPACNDPTAGFAKPWRRRRWRSSPASSPFACRMGGCA
ncbi:MAG: pyridoxal phosphate-dependent aminotransferase [Chloroflexi bacterium]|nr:pyridoxal phosphate-dependent aminotransferase [Chloroflexota bacterium]